MGLDKMLASDYFLRLRHVMKHSYIVTDEVVEVCSEDTQRSANLKIARVVIDSDLRATRNRFLFVFTNRDHIGDGNVAGALR